MANNRTDYPQPLIFDFVQGSYVDGPGCRTVIFFKGCPLRCIWCHNPEAQSLKQEEFFYQDRCQQCQHCAATDCLYGARKVVGIAYKANDLLAMIRRNKAYFADNGGVTFSGGEPLLWPDYLLALAKPLKEEGIHLTIDTCGHFDYKKCQVLLTDYIDLVLFDLKIMAPSKHQQYTGRDNGQILANFQKLYDLGVTIQPVIPLVPTMTATRENLKAIANFLAKYNLAPAIFHPYHTSMTSKLAALGRDIPSHIPTKPLGQREQRQWEDIFR